MALRAQLVSRWNAAVLSMLPTNLLSICLQLLESMTEQSRINVQKAVRKLRPCNSCTW